MPESDLDIPIADYRATTATAYEQIVQNYLMQEKFLVKKNPEIQGFTPDFFAEKEGFGIVIEVLTLFETKMTLLENVMESNPEIKTTAYVANLGAESLLIKNRIHEKTKKYKIAKNQPFLLAICDGEEMNFIETVLDYALYGPLTVRTNDGQVSRNLKKGILTKNVFCKKQENTRISGVLFCQKSKNTKYQINILHNPWAKHPIDPLLFSLAPQFIYQDSKLAWTREHDTSISL